MSTQDVPMAGLGDIMDNDAPLFGVPVRRAKVTPPDLSPYTVSSIRATVRQYRAHCRAHGYDPDVAQAISLESYTEELVALGYAERTIRTRVSRVRTWHAMHGRGRVVSDRIKQRTAEYGDYLKSLKTGVPVQRRPPGRRRSTTPPPDVTAPFAD